MVDWRVAKMAVKKVGRLVGALVVGSVFETAGQLVALTASRKAAMKVFQLAVWTVEKWVFWMVVYLVASKDVT